MKIFNITKRKHEKFLLLLRARVLFGNLRNKVYICLIELIYNGKQQ